MFHSMTTVASTQKLQGGSTSTTSSRMLVVVTTMLMMIMNAAVVVEASFEDAGIARGASWETCESTGACVSDDDDDHDIDVENNGNAAQKSATETNDDNDNAVCMDIFGNECADYVAESQGTTLEEACIEHFAEMSRGCRKSCHLCDNVEPTDVRTLVLSPFSRLHPQSVAGTPEQQQTMLEYNRKVEEYMYQQVYPEPGFNEVKVECQNRHELCLFWAAAGECEANPAYMKMQCAPSCLSCGDLSFKGRCPFDENAPTALSKEGDLDNLFRRMVTEEQFQQYTPTVLSQPDPPADSGILQGPWVVTLDNFISEEECDVMIELGRQKGYERSQDVGAKKFDGTYDGQVNQGRTSTNAWCVEDCWQHNVTQAIHERMEEVIRIPRGNYEHLQLLNYQEGQRYEEHHDYIEHHLDRFPGVRILTVFLYLNDVEAGGGTYFPRLNKTVVYPKRGRALIWPSVLDSDPNKREPKTFHEALPVEAGVKYGANAWVHQRDFKEVWSKGCH